MTRPRLSGFVTMGYPWLTTTRCGYLCCEHAGASRGREAVGSHHAVWNRRYIEPKPGYTLEQLWADSKPTMSKKTSTSYEIQTNDVLRAVAAIQHLPSPTPPDSPFLRALGATAALKAPPQTSAKSPGEMGTHFV